MKKWMFALLCVLMVMGYAVAEDVQIIGGANIEEAVQIQESIICRANDYAHYEGWYCFEAPVDGECYLAFYGVPQVYSMVDAYDMKGSKVFEGVPEVNAFSYGSFEVEEGEKYYL